MYIKQLGSDLLSSSVLNQKQHTNLKQSVLFTSGRLRNCTVCHGDCSVTEIDLLALPALHKGDPWVLFTASAAQAVSCWEEECSCFRQQRTVTHDSLVWTSSQSSNPYCIFKYLPFILNCGIATGFYSSYSLHLCSLSSGMEAGRTGCPVSPGSLALWDLASVQRADSTPAPGLKGPKSTLYNVWCELLTSEMPFLWGLPCKTTAVVSPRDREEQQRVCSDLPRNAAELIDPARVSLPVGKSCALVFSILLDVV